jgi:hypothetical protein
MIGFIRKLLKDRRGNALAIACAAMPLVIGAAGLATDTIEWTLWKRQLQRAADSAAIAGVYDRLSATGATTNTSNAVCNDLGVNLHTWMDLKATSPCTGTVGSYKTLTYPADTSNQTYAVEVTLEIQQSLPFSSLFMSSAPVIQATARAAAIGSTGLACIESLDPSTSTGVTFSGGSTIEMPNCDVFSNSSATNAAVGKGNTSVIANSVGAVGGVQQSNNFTVNSYKPYSSPLPDPFAGVTPDPTDMKCAGHWVTTGNNGNGGGQGNVTTWVYDALTDGTDMSAARDQNGNPANCWTALSVGSNRTLNVPANFGPIYVNGGNAQLQGNFSCTGCTIVMTNKDTSNTATIGTITVNAGVNTNITAPTTGTYKGIAIYQDRRASICTGNCNNLNGNSSSIITGAIYTPRQEVYYNGTGTVTATCTMFVSYRVTFNGNSALSNKFQDLTQCSGAGLPGNATTKVVRLVA